MVFGMISACVQHGHGERRSEHRLRGIAEQPRIFRTGAGGAHGVRHGIERQDCREGPVDILLQGRENLGPARTLCATGLNCRWRDGQQPRFQQRAKERDAERNAHIDEQERHALRCRNVWEGIMPKLR